jgi:hypothetical protein
MKARASSLYKTAKFDETAPLQAPHDYGALLERNATDDRSGSDWLKLEERATKIRYELPTDRSSLEVMRNYENALKGKGFTIVFSCADKACFNARMNDPRISSGAPSRLSRRRSDLTF